MNNSSVLYRSKQIMNNCSAVACSEYLISGRSDKRGYMMASDIGEVPSFSVSEGLREPRLSGFEPQPGVFIEKQCEGPRMPWRRGCAPVSVSRRLTRHTGIVFDIFR